MDTGEIRLLTEKAHYFEVLEYAQRTIEVHGSSHELLLYIVIALHETGQSDKAIETFQSFLGLYGKEAASPILEGLRRPIGNSLRICTLQDVASAGLARELGKFDSTQSHPALRVYECRNIFLLGDVALPVTENGCIISDAALNVNSDRAVLLASLGIARSGQTTLSGSYLPLYSRWSGNFFHWCMESLPRVILGEQSGFLGTYLIPPGLAYARGSLQALGIPENRIREHAGSAIFVESVVLPTTLSGGDLGRYPAILEALRGRIMANVKPRHHNGRVYLSRNKGSQKRRIVNEKELLGVLQSYDFQILYAEDLSFEQQIARMMGATALVSPHGASMVHTMFMKPGSLILEGFAPDYVNPCMTSVCDYLGHRYYMLPSLVNEPVYKHGSDIELPLEVVAQILRRELA